MDIQTLLNKICNQDNLLPEESRFVMQGIMEGQWSPTVVAALLGALRTKGESPEEIAVFAETMRDLALDMSLADIDFTDTCGTGGDGSHSFNISTTAAIIACGAGAAIAKHGNRSISSKSGSADVLAALGIGITADPDKIRQSLKEVGIGFLFAPRMHQAMKHVMPVRKELGIRTVFNMLGPLTNPARARRQIIGVYRPELCEVYARILKQMGHTSAYVVHGHGPLDEVSLSGPSQVAYLNQGKLDFFEVEPGQFGLDLQPMETIHGGGPEENAAIILHILEGMSGAPRDIACLNAAFAIHLSGLAQDLKEGLTLAFEAVDSGKAKSVLKRWRTICPVPDDGTA